MGVSLAGGKFGRCVGTGSINSSPSSRPVSVEHELPHSRPPRVPKSHIAKTQKGRASRTWKAAGIRKERWCALAGRTSKDSVKG